MVAAVPLVGLGRLPGVYLAAVLLSAYASFEAIAALPHSAQHLRGGFASATRLYELVNDSPPVVDPPTPRPAPALPALQVEGLSFRYPPVLDRQPGESTYSGWENPWILQEVSFSLPPGKRVALVGPSGSGKSTLVSLLLRFWQFDCGRILLGSRCVQEYSQKTVRSQLAVLQQNPYLFSASLKDNLLLASTPGAQVSEEQVARAVRAACLDSFIAGLPQGYRTWVGEHGVCLSAGERQRLAIARTLLSAAPILVLDEPTAHLDALTERAVMRSLLGSLAGRSLLLITHHLVGMEAMDEILVLSGGRLVERGLHTELLDSAGLYCRMWDLQRQQIPADSAL